MLKDKAAAKSNGELVIDILGGPEVIPLIDQGTATKKGVIDIGYVFSAAYRGLVPISGVIPFSALSPSAERASGFYDFLAAQFTKAGLVYLGRGATTDGQYIFNLWVKKQITKPQEIAGLKIGGVTAASNAFMTALGASPVLVTYGEVYVALQSGVIDGYWDAIPTFAGMKLFEIPVYLINHPYYQSNVIFIMNPDRWNKLSKRLQDVLMQSIMEIEKEEPPIYLAEINRNKQIMLNAGTKLITFSPADAKLFLDTAVNAGWDEQVKLNPALAPQAKELLTAK